jgi:ribosomal protein S18 acetylase RimI-like enzyme
MSEPIRIRPVAKQDLPAVAALAGELVRMHHATDARRFMLVENVEQGYVWWFGRQLDNPAAVILVAVRDGAIVGYAYGSREERDWNLLLDEYGAIHDLYVTSEARRGGLGRRLLEALVERLEAMGAVRIVLSTMVSNHPAQRLFAACGFRPTMLEMTRA